MAWHILRHTLILITGWLPKAPGTTGLPLPTCLPVLSWAPPPRKINDAGKHQVCCIYMMHIAPYSPSIVLWCMTKLPICQTLNSSQDNLFSAHSQSFSFCTTVTENSLGIFHLERMEKGEQKHPSAPSSPMSHTAPAHWGGNRPVPEHLPIPHQIAPPSNCTQHLGPFPAQPFSKAILLVWTLSQGCSSKDQTMTSFKDLAFSAQRRQLERQEYDSPLHLDATTWLTFNSSERKPRSLGLF